MEQSRTFYAKRNVIFGVMGKLLVIVLEFFSRAVFIQFLGEELLGINGVFTNVIQLLSLAELGLANVVNFSFYKPLAQKDYGKIAALLSYFKTVYNVIAMVVAGIGLLLLPVLKYIVNTNLEIQNLHGIYLIFLAETVFSYLFVYKASLMNAAQYGFVVAKYEMAITVLRTGMQMAVVALFHSVELYLIVRVIFNVGSNWLVARRVDKEFPQIKEHISELQSIEKKGILKVVQSGFIYKLSGMLLNATDNILLSMLVSTITVGYLSNYVMIITGIGSVYTIIFANITAGIGNLVSTETKERKLEVFNILICVSGWMAIAFSVCFFLLSEEFITLWLGAEFVIDNASVLMKALMLYLSCMLQPVFGFREALGLYQKTKYAMLAAAIINIVLSIVLGIKWGMAGVLGASIIAMLTTYLWYEPIVLYRDCFGASVKQYFGGRLKEICALLLAIVCLGWLGKVWVAETWLMWIVKSVVFFGVVNVYCLLLYHKNSGFKELLCRLKERFA